MAEFSLFPPHWELSWKISNDLAYRYLGHPRNQYIYAWVHNNSVFYVGCGKRGRGLMYHDNGKQEAALCQRKRESLRSGFQCIVVKDNLDVDTAFAVESELILICRPECNYIYPAEEHLRIANCDVNRPPGFNEPRKKRKRSVKRSATKRKKSVCHITQYRSQMKMKYLQAIKRLVKQKKRESRLKEQFDRINSTDSGLNAFKN